MKKIKFLFLGLFFIIPFFVFVEKSSLREISRPSSPSKKLYLLETVFRHIRNDYIQEVNPNKVVEGSFRGLVNALDNCSGYLDRQITARYLAQKENIVAETGLILFKKPGGFLGIVGIHEDSPAQAAGLKIGDIITEINKQSTSSMSLTEVNVILQGNEGEPVELKILRDEKTLEMKVGRARLRAKPACYAEEKEVGGILKIVRLSPPLSTELKTAILPRHSPPDKPLIIDLRTCPEGTFEEASQFINLFLKTESIGYIEKAGGKRESLSASDNPLLPNTLLLVWISQATLGPAEVVAAVLKENGRAKVIGVPTLGLAARNAFFALPDGTSVLLTSGVFSLPSGAKLWGQGVEPDVPVEVGDLSSSAYLKKSKNLLSAP